MKTLASTPKGYLCSLQQFTGQLSSFSLVNNEGQLLYSKDTKTEALITTRLVAFQIIKKYLQPKPLDLFILNDPENGGFNLTQMIFVTALHENLYLIWDEELNQIDFKIPPTPLYEKNQKNAFVWKALVEDHPQSGLLKEFFEAQKRKLDGLLFQKEHIHLLAQSKHQAQWLKACQEIFDTQFSNKPLGSAESTYRVSPTQIIKLKITAEEKQNLRLITLDFTNTSLANGYSASSHVVESALIKKLIQFYEIENFFTQAILDKIKIILPPKSIVSKASPKGEWNHEIQGICSQLCVFNLAGFNAQMRKTTLAFEISPELKFDLLLKARRFEMFLDQKNICLDELEPLLQQNYFEMLSLKKHDQAIYLSLKVLGEGENTLQLKIKSKLFQPNKDYSLKINSEIPQAAISPLKSGDHLELHWKTLS